MTHYGDTATSGTTKTMSPVQSGMRIFSEVGGFAHINTYHSLKFSMTTNNETIGFEPIFIALGYSIARQNWISNQ